MEEVKIRLPKQWLSADIRERKWHLRITGKLFPINPAPALQQILPDPYAQIPISFEVDRSWGVRTPGEADSRQVRNPDI